MVTTWAKPQALDCSSVPVRTSHITNGCEHGNQLDRSFSAPGLLLSYAHLTASWDYLDVSHCYLYGPGSASGFYSDFTSQLPDENLYWEHHLSSNSVLPSSTNSTLKLLLLLTPCFSSWPDLKATSSLIASFTSFFLLHRIQPITKLMHLPSLIHHLHIRATILVWTLIFFFRNYYWILLYLICLIFSFIFLLDHSGIPLIMLLLCIICSVTLHGRIKCIFFSLVSEPPKYGPWWGHLLFVLPRSQFVFW